jgi:hypothetical protein
MLFLDLALSRIFFFFLYATPKPQIPITIPNIVIGSGARSHEFEFVHGGGVHGVKDVHGGGGGGGNFQSGGQGIWQIFPTLGDGRKYCQDFD